MSDLTETVARALWHGDHSWLPQNPDGYQTVPRHQRVRYERMADAALAAIGDGPGLFGTLLAHGRFHMTDVWRCSRCDTALDVRPGVHLGDPLRAAIARHQADMVRAWLRGEWA